MLIAVPLELKAANAFVSELHRHHIPVHRDKFRVGVSDGEHLVGVAQVGRPVSRVLDDGETLEVVRCCTDGTKNACSFLYSRCARIAEEMGYSRIITYILESEDGSSLKASGWYCEAKRTGGVSWDTPARERERENSDLFGSKQKYPAEKKQRWVKALRKKATKGGIV